MSLILAIEPDRGQAARLADAIRGRLGAELVHAETTEGALEALARIGDRVPDLVLVPSLLSAQEDVAIASALRMIAAAANVRMITIPLLADPQPAKSRGVFARLRARPAKATTGGCEPAVFADQIATYLAEAAAERQARAEEADLVAPVVAAPHDPEPLPQPEWVPAEPEEAPLDDVVTPVMASPASEPEVLPLVETYSDAQIETAGSPAVEDIRERYAPLILEPRVAVQESVVESTTPPDAGAVRSVILRAAEAIDEPAAAIVEVAPMGETAEPILETAQLVAEQAPPIVEAEKAVADVTLPPAVVDVEETIEVAAGAATAEPIETQMVAPVEERSVAPLVESIAEPVAVMLPEPVVAATPVPESIVERVLIEDVAPPLLVIEEPPQLAAEAPVALVREEPEPVREPSLETVVETSESVLEAHPAFEELPAFDEAPVSDEEQTVDPALIASQFDEALTPEEIAVLEEAARLSAAPQPVSGFDDVADVATLFVGEERIDGPGVDARDIGALNEAPLAEEPFAVSGEANVPPIELALSSPVTIDLDAPELAGSECADAPTVTEHAETPAEVRRRSGTPGRVRRRKKAAAPTSEPDEAIDIDALIAPLLSEIVATRTSKPTRREAVEASAPLLVPQPVPQETIPAAPPPVAEPPAPPVVKPIAAASIATPASVAPVPPARVEIPSAPPLPPELDVDPMFFADDVAEEGRKDPAPHDRPAWVELIESLRKDIERLKWERVEGQPPPASVVSAPAVPEPRPAAPPVSNVGRIAIPSPREKAPKPVQDQWGLFDPEQCGFAALRAKLDEISSRDEVSA